MGRDKKAEEAAIDAAIARDFVMARLLAAGAAVAAARDALDELASLFVGPDQDASGKKRAKLLEQLNAACGDAAASAQLAMAELENIDPTESEPEPGDDDDDDDDEDDDEEDGDDEDEDDAEEAPPRRGGRR